jgi:hypothetical protein
MRPARKFPFLLAGMLLLSSLPAAAQMVGGVVGSPRVVIAEPPSFAEVAVSSCAGGAMIGVLAVLVTGVGTPGSTAALFCGLSVAATAASAVTYSLWHRTTAVFY